MAIHHIDALDTFDQGDWEHAHRIIQDYNDELSCLIHGYLHREEGDLSNASYWYSRIGQDLPDNSLDEEFDLLYQMASNSYEELLADTFD